MSSFDIPQSINPVRYQASLGGNVKSTTINNTSEQFQIELAIVKKVFYRKGTLLFSVIKRGSSVSIIGNDTSSATASAPIPVETFGRNSDGKVFGGYRPVKVGSKIAVGYINGERSAPIVLGVYPDDDESYEIVSPVSFETGEDSDKSVEDIALGSKEITASQNIIYQSGKGDILKTFNGKSLLYINANGSNYMDDINYAYDQIADTRDGNMNPITPRETRAQSWLLVHEDNPEDEETNGHRTRFYVNKNGEFQMVMFSPNNDGDNNLVVFTASKDDGFKLRKQFDTDDLDSSEQYVQFSIGSGNSAVIQSVDKDDASEISMLPNGLQLTTPDNGTMAFNGRSLDSMLGSISSAVDAAKAAGDKATTAASAGAIAQSAASEAASQAALASQAGEDAKHAAVDAQAAGEDAKAQAQDTQQRIIYYASISNEKDVAVPGKYIIVNTDTYIANGTIKTAHIGDAAITNAKIADLAVGTAQLEDAAITRAKIGNLAVGTAQIEDAAITDAKVGDLSADHLKAGTIDFSVISGIHINASEIDVGKIVADQIFVNGLGDISKNLGTVTSGNITGTNLNNDVETVTSEALAAQSTANAAKEAADSAYDYANSEIAVQSNATQNAQSKADSAFSQAQTAIDNNQATNAEITKLRNGSTMTIADLENGLATKVANSDYASYKVQTASQIAQKVDNGAFSAYQTTAADLIAQKVATSDFSAYQATTAKEISSKVESSDFQTYQTQTADVIASKVSTVDFNNLTISNRNLALGTATPFTLVGQNTANQSKNAYQFSRVIPKGTLVTVTFDISSSTGVGTYTMQFNGSDTGSSWQTISTGNLANGTKHISVTITTDSDHLHIYPRLDNATGAITLSNFIISESSKEVNWTPAPEDQATQSQITQLSGDINLRVTKDDLIDQINIQAGNTLISSSGQLTLSGKTIYFDTTNPVIIPSANIDSLLVNHSLNNGNGTFTVDSNGNVTASSLTVRGVTNLVYNAALLGGNGSNIPGWSISNNGCYWPGNVHDGVPSIGWNNTTGAGAWVNFAQTKLVPLNGTTGIPFSASVWFLDFGSDTSLQYGFNLAFFDSSGNRIGVSGPNWNGASSNTGWRYLTINNAIAPSTAVYVGLQYWANNGKGNAEFSSPMLTQTAQATGYQPDTGNVVSAGIVNGSTINASTFNAGNIISDSNNTSSFYPFTIESTGKASTTSFTSMDALRTEMSGGGIRTMYRATNSSGSQYEAYDGYFNGNMISLNSGFTNGKDMSFSQSVTGNQLTGQVLISPLDGINLWGSTQSIHFSGLQMNGTGVTLNSYGNLIGDVGSTWWRIIDSSGNQVANFGTSPGNNTSFPKPIFVDEIGAYSGSNGHALFIHGDDSTSSKTGQMLFRTDGSPQIVSATIYNRTYSSGSTVTVTSYGTLGRITSASKYKLDITKETSLEPANKLLSIDRSSWVDKESAERLANSKTNGTELSEPEINVNRHYGLIAEDLIKAGLDEFVIKGDNGQAEGIEYDRLWTVLIPKIRDLSNQQIDDRMTISRLEKEIKNLKQEVLSK